MRISRCPTRVVCSLQSLPETSERGGRRICPQRVPWVVKLIANAKWVSGGRWSCDVTSHVVSSTDSLSLLSTDLSVLVHRETSACLQLSQLTPTSNRDPATSAPNNLLTGLNRYCPASIFQLQDDDQDRKLSQDTVSRHCLKI